MADTIKKNIGKNTIGDNGKIQVDLRTYNRSTHDLSGVFRNTQSPGTLVPCECILALKEDTFEIETDAQILTHPTTGPLYGSFKFEVHWFQAPLRLYNSWLHNNRTGIGMNMAQVKFPMLNVDLNSTFDNPTEENEFSQINPSCVLAYLGLRGYGYVKERQTPTVSKNAIPLIAYYDIFKNYYANKQEENFYIIGQQENLRRITVKDEQDKQIYKGSPNPIQWIQLKKGYKIILEPSGYTEDQLIIHVWDKRIPGYNDVGVGEIGVYDQLQSTITILAEEVLLVGIENTNKATLKKYKLEDLDEFRDTILGTKGNQVLNITGENSIDLYKSFNERFSGTRKKLYTTSSQYGLALKTYNSDLYQNWIDTEWIEGVNGINEISSVDVSSGQLTMDSLNLAQKVYNMLNRIAVSGGTYKDWLETVYTGNYIERCEAPIFEGGISQEIVFQEVVSQAASDKEPLGTLAGRGVTANNKKGGKIKIKVTEPSFIIGICSITPRIDYSQGNEFYTELKNMDDLHKPALDGIGYQDSINTGRAYWDDYLETTGKTTKRSAGKTVAWINYMTAVNKCYGNFADNQSEAFMVLNRNYTMKNNGTNTEIEDLTTYIDPVKFNYVFADTNLDAMNFWVQIKKTITARRVMSAKQIPNL